MSFTDEDRDVIANTCNILGLLVRDGFVKDLNAIELIRAARISLSKLGRDHKMTMDAKDDSEEWPDDVAERWKALR